MTYQSISSADLVDREGREEMRFLRDLKGTLRESVAEVLDERAITQEVLANEIGIAPAQLSRALSADRHNSTLSLFRIMYRIGRRWKFSVEKLNSARPAGNFGGADDAAEVTTIQEEISEPPSALWTGGSLPGDGPSVKIFSLAPHNTLGARTQPEKKRA